MWFLSHGFLFSCAVHMLLFHCISITRCHMFTWVHVSNFLAYNMSKCTIVFQLSVSHSQAHVACEKHTDKIIWETYICEVRDPFRAVGFYKVQSCTKITKALITFIIVIDWNLLSVFPKTFESPLGPGWERKRRRWQICFIWCYNGELMFLASCKNNILLPSGGRNLLSASWRTWNGF